MSGGVRACCLWIAPAFSLAAEDRFLFRVNTPAEMIAELDLRSPGADWSVPGREAAVATVTLDGSRTQHVMLFAGPALRTYSVFLGRTPPGEHSIAITRNAEHSAPGARLEVDGVRFVAVTADHPNYAAVANAPVLFARGNTMGKFSDVPLLTYCERLQENGQELLQYTVIFSNEDGGTSTRALMARWGRTTDIEYLYKAYLGPDQKTIRATMQTRDHAEVEFRGRRESGHPLLMPVTNNNMVADEGESPIRYQLAPVVVDLTARAREQVMDDHPVTYEVMVKELEREGKLRGFGTVEGEKISHPRNYLFVEYEAININAAVAVQVRLQGETRWHSSNLGRLDYVIGRAGRVRTTVELPPGTQIGQVAEIGFECLATAQTGVCELKLGTSMFLLNEHLWPGLPVRLTAPAARIAAGETERISVPQK